MRRQGQGRISVDKAKNKRDAGTSSSLKSEVEKATTNPGMHGRDERVWVRDDGAVCFDDECVVIKPDADGALNLTINPDSCGAAAGSAILEHLIRTAGKGVHIVVPPQEVSKKYDKD